MASHPADPAGSSELSFNVRHAAHVPLTQEVYFVTTTEWSHIKDAIQRIRPSESLWLTLMSSSFSVGVSFLTVLIPLEFEGAIKFALRVFLYSATIAGFVGGIFSLIGFLESRKRKKEDVAVAIGYMTDIERVNRRREETPATQQEGQVQQ